MRLAAFSAVKLRFTVGIFKDFGGCASPDGGIAADVGSDFVGKPEPYRTESAKPQTRPTCQV